VYVPTTNGELYWLRTARREEVVDDRTQS